MWWTHPFAIYSYFNLYQKSARFLFNSPVFFSFPFSFLLFFHHFHPSFSSSTSSSSSSSAFHLLPFLSPPLLSLHHFCSSDLLFKVSFFSFKIIKVANCNSFSSFLVFDFTYFSFFVLTNVLICGSDHWLKLVCCWRREKRREN